MFESAELGHRIDKERYKQEVPELREALLNAQLDLREADFPVIIIIAGVDGAGKGETVNILNEWMDPRHIQTNALDVPTDEELERPEMWRFWRALPPKGKIGIFFGSWYTDPIVGRALGTMKPALYEDHLDRIVNLEQMLADEGVVILKLWFHLSKSEQKKRLTTLEKDKATRWRVTKRDWAFFEKYDAFRSVSEAVIRRTSTGPVPWHIIEGSDAHYRSLTSATLLLDAMKRGLAATAARSPKRSPSARTTP